MEKEDFLEERTAQFSPDGKNRRQGRCPGAYIQARMDTGSGETKKSNLVVASSIIGTTK